MKWQRESEALPEEAAPVEEALPPAEEPVVTVTGSAKASVNSPTQQIFANVFIPKITLPVTAAWQPQATGTSSGTTAILEDLKRELPPRETVESLPEAAADASTDPLALTLTRIQQQFEHSMAADAHENRMAIGVATGLGVSVFAGYVIWALRGASLLVGALSTLPMWRCFDPLPVLLRDEKLPTENEGRQSKAADDKEEERVKALLDAERNAAGEPTPNQGVA